MIDPHLVSFIEILAYKRLIPLILLILHYAKIEVNNTSVTVIQINDQDYISLTDMLKARDGEYFFYNWLRNRNTIEFLGIWETVNNPNFNSAEFDRIKSLVGLNSFRLSAKEWMEKTGAVGIISKAGRYGGTYAHKDIAFEFAMWISPEFKVYLIREFQRLKEKEQEQLGWSAKRELSKINSRIHTDAIKQNLIPPTLTKAQTQIVYATEADVLNMAQFGMTARQCVVVAVTTASVFLTEPGDDVTLSAVLGVLCHYFKSQGTVIATEVESA